MAEDPTAPALNLSPEEKRVFAQLFRLADTENIGVVTGEVAVKFFEKTRLEPRILGEIWQIADKENRGLLTPAGFGIVLRLIGHYQAGRDPTPELAFRPGPLPKFDGGLGNTSPTFQAPPGPPPSALQPQPSGSGPIRVPPLSADKAAQYAQLFEKSGAQGGILPGEQAKQIFERAGLPNEILGRIWNLADTEQRGALTTTEFVIAMHLLASFKSNQLRALPNILPAGLYEAATRRGPPSRQPTGNGISAIPRQFSGQQGRASSPLSRPAYTPPQQMPQPTGGEWAINPMDKQKFDGIYHGLDRSGKGFITGDEAVPFFSESKLPEEVLAQIWDLADINSAGHLTIDEFAVAMFLIRQQRGKKDGRDSLPATLPPNLIPPSMRNQVRPAPMPTAPAFEAPPPTMPKSAAEDLFGLDALSSPPAPVQAPQPTGGSASFGQNRQLNTDPFGGSAQPLTPTSPVQTSPQHTGSVFKPFVPSSSFGHTLTANATGGSNNSGPSRGFSQQPSVGEDLLGDNDPEISSKLTSETTELANLSNQVGTLSTQMQQVQGQRSATQNELTQADSQKQQFEARLGQLRALYEQEVKDVRSLEERLTTSRNETKKLQTEMAMLEGTYTDLQTQHRQIVTALQADQQENASLKERMRVVNAEISQLKPSLEKLRSDARQQKGLVAINKKQLATNESERDKLKGEASDLTRSIEEDTATLAAAAARARSQSPVHARAQSPASVASPAPSTMSANNPFFKRQVTGGSNNDMGSPFAASPVQQTDRSFENVFGPAFGSALPHQEVAAPPTSFKQELPTRPQTSGGFSTPSLSEAPPPMPVSRQMSSSYLPFPTHDDSVSSSRQVSAPNSRFGDNSTGGDTPTNYMGTTPQGSSPAHTAEPVVTARAVSPDIDRRSTASPAVTDTKESIPGAFPGDDNSNIVTTPTGGTTLSEQATADPFATTKEPVRSGTAKDDFDAAFAGFGSSGKALERSNTGSSAEPSATAAAPSSFGQEFPPISELENDDDSDSASEGGFGGGGFDDDFNPASPAQVRKAPESPVLSHTAGSTAGSAKEFLSAPAPAAAAGSDPPTPNAQASPPAYDKAVSPADQAHSEVQQYSGLLPSREVPSPEQSTSSATAAPQTTFGAPQASSQSAPPSKVPFDDDFGDDFDDLEDAKEGETDDDFGVASSSLHESRNGLDDFNPMFDSPPTSKQQDHTSNSFGGDGTGFGDFSSSPKQTTAAPAADNHDWDAIFAGLDGPGAEASSSATQANNSGMTSNEIPKAGPVQNLSGAARPQVGRALTEGGEHDDPILKNLTGMGYPRNDALAALEKYDYNLERAANFLANQS